MCLLKCIKGLVSEKPSAENVLGGFRDDPHYYNSSLLEFIDVNVQSF